MTTTILQLENLTKRYEKIIPVDNLSLNIYEGEFFTFLGPSGSGKSTVLRLIAGLEQPDKGRVLIAGKDMTNVVPWQRNLGMVFQQYALFPNMNVEQNIGYGLRIQKMPKDEIRTRVTELLSLVGLAGREKTNVTVLSGGQQQRVALARALALNPPLLLFDEPLGALDEKIRREMQTELKRIQQRTGTTFLYVTHDQEEALTMSDRIAVMHRGIAVQCDTPETIFRHPRTRFVASFFRGCNIVDARIQSVRGEYVEFQLADMCFRLPIQHSATAVGNTVPLGLRAENVRVGSGAMQCQVRKDVELIDIIYRGLTTDYLVQLADGQRLVATTTQREVQESVQTVPLGFQLEDLLLLEEDDVPAATPAENELLRRDEGAFRAHA